MEGIEAIEIRNAMQETLTARFLRNSTHLSTKNHTDVRGKVDTENSRWTSLERLELKRLDIEHKAVLHIALDDAVPGFIQLGEAGHLDVGGDPLLSAEFEHLLSLGNAAHH